MTDSLVLRGRQFDVTVHQESTAIGNTSWQWILASPGKLVLSGEASSADQAMRSARRIARLWARLNPTA
jgi:hypothetical protein